MQDTAESTAHCADGEHSEMAEGAEASHHCGWKCDIQAGLYLASTAGAGWVIATHIFPYIS